MQGFCSATLEPWYIFPRHLSYKQQLVKLFHRWHLRLLNNNTWLNYCRGHRCRRYQQERSSLFIRKYFVRSIESQYNDHWFVWGRSRSNSFFVSVYFRRILAGVQWVPFTMPNKTSWFKINCERSLPSLKLLFFTLMYYFKKWKEKHRHSPGDLIIRWSICSEEIKVNIDVSIQLLGEANYVTFCVFGDEDDETDVSSAWCSRTKMHRPAAMHMKTDNYCINQQWWKCWFLGEWGVLVAVEETLEHIERKKRRTGHLSRMRPIMKQDSLRLPTTCCGRGRRCLCLLFSLQLELFSQHL